MNRQRRLRPWLLGVGAAAVLAACGGGAGGVATGTGGTGVQVATFSDAAVSGLEYSSASTSGITDTKGNFEYVPGEAVTFSIGNVVLGQAIPTAGTTMVRPLDLVPGATGASDVRVTRILQTLQSLDSDGDPETNGIHIEAGTREHMRLASTRAIRLDSLETQDSDVEAYLPTGGYTVDASAARDHYERHADDASNADLGYVPPNVTVSNSAVTAVSQPVSSAGRLLASNCFQCHGTGGLGGFERIRGGEASEVFEYTGRTANTSIMAAHAQGFTRAQLDAIVSYLNQ